MSSELIYPLKASANPAKTEVAIGQSNRVVDEYIDQLEAIGNNAALDALTKIVMDRAKTRGQYFVQEDPQHDS